MTEISVVIPAFNEEPNLKELAAHLLPALDSLDASWEVILVDDGSQDDTWAEIGRLHDRDNRFKGIRLSRNFGHQYALFAGMNSATGSAVIMMDGDLQHPPSVLPTLVDRWRAGYKIVNTVRVDPPDFSWLKRVTAKVYYRLFSFLSGVRIEHGMADFRLIDRQVLLQLLALREEGLFLRGLVQWVGFPKTSVEFECHERFRGATKYSPLKMLRFAWHGISSFSIVPLRLGIVLGIATSFLAFFWLLEAVLSKLVYGTAIPGWASTVGILSFLFGMLFIFLGVIGEYIGRILIQVRDRPLFIVSDSIGVKAQSESM